MDYPPLSLLGRIFSSQPRTLQSLAPPMQNYPTSEEAANALKYGFGSGDPRRDAYVTGQTGRIMAKRDPRGGYAPLAGTDYGSLDTMMGRLDRDTMQLSPAPFGMSDIYTRAALAANRIPIASLGFDPGRMSMDTQVKHGNIAGVYSPENDVIYFNQSDATPSTPVHESIHRGLEILKQDPANAETFKYLPDDESTVRYLMATQAGDPEKDTGEAGQQQREEALLKYGQFDPPGQVGGVRKFALNRLTRAAEEAVKNRNPRGPR